MRVTARMAHFSTSPTIFRAPKLWFSNKFVLETSYEVREWNGIRQSDHKFLPVSFSNSSLTLMEQRIFDVVIFRQRPLACFSRLCFISFFTFGNLISLRLKRDREVVGSSLLSNGFRLLLYRPGSSVRSVVESSVEVSHNSRIISACPLGLDVTYSRKIK